MGFHVKGLHDDPCVQLVYDRFSSVWGDLFNELPMPSASMPEVIVIIICLNFMSYLPNEFLFISSHLCDRQVRYDISHYKGL